MIALHNLPPKTQSEYRLLRGAKSNLDHPSFPVLVTLHGLNGFGLLDLFHRAIYGQSYDGRSL